MRGFARGQIDRRVVRNRFALSHLLDRQGDREGDGHGALSPSVRSDDSVKISSGCL